MSRCSRPPPTRRGWTLAGLQSRSGFRGLLAREIDGRTRLISRRGTDLSVAFPELIDAAADLPVALGDVAFDGEVVIWNGGLLDFGLLLKRLNRRPAAALALAREHPAHFVAFDLLHLAGRDLAREPYRVRRAELERVFTDHMLSEPWILTPSTTDPAEVALWLTAWVPLGIEGIVLKQLTAPYRGGKRGWHQWVRNSFEVVVGAVTGSTQRPQTLLLGAHAADGRLRFLGRTTPLTARASADLAPYLVPAGPDHPWQGRKLTGIFDRGSARPPRLVDPLLVVEVASDGIGDSYGRWRHPARFLRQRPDLSPREAAGTAQDS